MGFQEAKRAAQHRRSRKRAPQLASTVLRVVETNPDELRVMVELSDNAAAALGLDNNDPLPVEERLNPKHSKTQPNIKDLLGLPGGTSSQSMKVEPGSTILADEVRIEDGKISVGWFQLASGPRADKEAGKSATVLDGHILTRSWKSRETGGRRFAAEVVFSEQARQVGNDAGLGEAVASALDSDGPGRGFAIVRISGANGDTLHRPFRRRRAEDGSEIAAAEIAREAVDSMGSGSETVALLREGDNPATVTEVIPARRISIGTTAQSQLETALTEKTGDRMNTGSKKFRTAEMHPSDRGQLPINRKVDKPASPKQLAFLENLAKERGISVPEEAKSSSAGASAFLDERKLILGYAPGQLVVREGVNSDDGEIYDFAIACALHRRSGVPIEAVATPGCPKAPEAARSNAEAAVAARADLMAGKLPMSDDMPAGQQADVPEDEVDPDIDPDSADEEEFDAF